MYRSMFRPLLIASALSLVAATAQAEDFLYVQHGTYLNARNGPGTEYPADQVLRPGTQVSVLERQGDWMRVRTAEGAQVWVFGTYLGDQAPQSKPQAEASGNTPPQGRDQDQPPQQQTRQLDLGQRTDEGPDQDGDQRPGQPSDLRSDARGPGKFGRARAGKIASAGATGPVGPAPAAGPIATAPIPGERPATASGVATMGTAEHPTAVDRVAKPEHRAATDGSITQRERPRRPGRPHAAPRRATGEKRPTPGRSTLPAGKTAYIKIGECVRAGADPEEEPA